MSRRSCKTSSDSDKMLQKHVGLPGVCRHLVLRHRSNDQDMRAERGCNETMVLRGLTEFIESIGNISGNDEDSTDRQQAGSRAEEQIEIE